MAEANEPSSSSWGSWGSWGQSILNTVKESSTLTMEMVKKDLNELVDVLQGETAKPSETSDGATAVISEENRSEGNEPILDGLDSVDFDAATQFIKKGVSSFLSTVTDTVTDFITLPPDDTKEEILTVPGLPPDNYESSDEYLEKQEKLRQIQLDPGTYCNEPEGLFNDWREIFSLDDHKIEMSNILVQNPGVKSLYTQLVPTVVSHSTYWERYFFQAFLLDTAGKKFDQIRALNVPKESEVLGEIGLQKEVEMMKKSKTPIKTNVHISQSSHEPNEVPLGYSGLDLVRDDKDEHLDIRLDPSLIEDVILENKWNDIQYDINRNPSPSLVGSLEEPNSSGFSKDSTTSGILQQIFVVEDNMTERKDHSNVQVETDTLKTNDIDNVDFYSNHELGTEEIIDICSDKIEADQTNSLEINVKDSEIENKLLELRDEPILNNEIGIVPTDPLFISNDEGLEVIEPLTSSEAYSSEPLTINDVDVDVNAISTSETMLAEEISCIHSFPVYDNGVTPSLQEILTDSVLEKEDARYSDFEKIEKLECADELVLNNDVGKVSTDPLLVQNDKGTILSESISLIGAEVCSTGSLVINNDEDLDTVCSRDAILVEEADYSDSISINDIEVPFPSQTLNTGGTDSALETEDANKFKDYLLKEALEEDSDDDINVDDMDVAEMVSEIKTLSSGVGTIDLDGDDWEKWE